MVPRIDMVDIDATATVREALDLAIATGRSRLPVLGEGVDDVVGIVNLRHLASLVANGAGSAARRASTWVRRTSSPRPSAWRRC